MTFEEVMQMILQPFTGEDGFYYAPFVNGGGDTDDYKLSSRNDYDRIRDDGTFHGGVDFYYYKEVNDQPVSVGSTGYPNTYTNGDHPPVYAFVAGTVISAQTDKNEKVIKDGGVSILDVYGYVHTIYHLSAIYVKEGQQITDDDIGEDLELGKMGGQLKGNSKGVPYHVHYEITTFLYPPKKYQKIDPEAFWNNYPVDPANGFFTLTGSYKVGNQFYGTSNKEILRGEGVKDNDQYIMVNGQPKYSSEKDNDTLSGGGGSDIIDGGSGNDFLYGGNSDGENEYYNIVDGILYDAETDADESNDTLIGGMGKDYLDGGKGNDYLYGGVATISDGQVTHNEETDEDTSNDTLYGGAGNDTIYGGKGNDTIWGGPGDDVLYGGANDDTYIVNTGDGTDTIEDKQGNNKVMLCGKPLKFFYDKGGYQYTTADGTITAEMQETDLVVTHTASGTKVILNEDFQPGDFGINLLDMPDAPTTTLLGDLTPTSDPPQYDSLGNVIVDPNTPSPGRNDYLYDSTTNDRIEGKGGNDILHAMRGGDDLLAGGEGNDIILAGEGDDNVFSENEGEMDKRSRELRAWRGELFNVFLTSQRYRLNASQGRMVA